MKKITPFLWFDTQAEEAMNFYVSVFKNSKLEASNARGPDGPVFSVTFELDGQEFMGLNAGPRFKFNELISFFVNCENQKEVDEYWSKLIADGGEESMCGWCRDKFGLWWQIIPKQLGEWMGDPNPEKSQRVVQAMLKMQRIIVADLQKAYDGNNNAAQVAKKRDLIVTRVFDAPIDLVWKAWIDPELVMRWWGPDYFTSPSAKMDFREGGTSIVCMRAPKDFGGQDMYSTWLYQKIVPMERIEFIQNLADKDGNLIDPAQLGLPPEFPRDIRTVVTLKDLGNSRTEMTVIEYDMPTLDTEMGRNAEIGLNQSLDKMAASFAKD